MKLNMINEANSFNIENMYPNEAYLDEAIALFKKQMDSSDKDQVKILDLMLKQKKEMSDKKSKVNSMLDNLRDSIKGLYYF